MARARLAAAALAAAVAVAGRAAAVPMDLGMGVDRPVLVAFEPATEVSFDAFLAFDPSGDRATVTIPASAWEPALAALLAVIAPGLDLTEGSVSDYVFEFDLSSAPVEIRSARFTFSGVQVIPIDFTQTVASDRVVGRKSGSILGAVPTDQLFCDPAFETCLETFAGSPYDPATGRARLVGDLLGVTLLGTFRLVSPTQEVVFSEVPEPAGAALALAGVALALALRRRSGARAD